MDTKALAEHYNNHTEYLIEGIDHAVVAGDIKTIAKDYLEQQKQIALMRELYIAVNEMLAVIGAKGQINSKHARTSNVMDALYNLDGGEYKPDKIFHKNDNKTEAILDHLENILGEGLVSDHPRQAMQDAMSVISNALNQDTSDYVLVKKVPTEETLKAMEWQIGGTKDNPVTTWGTTRAIYDAAIGVIKENSGV